MMKKVLMHILFWIVYLAQDIALAYLGDAVALSHLSISTRILIAVKVCVSLLLPKILFTYFVLYILLGRILKERSRLPINIFYLILSFVLTLIVYRTIHIYYIYPALFDGIIKAPPYFKGASFLFAVMDLGFVSGSAIVIRQIRLQFAAKEKEKLLIKEKLETELKFLKNQTNPHFLFNTLNNIYALARKKSDKTADVVMKLSKILRFMLYESDKKFITISEEIKLIEDYIDLERIRYNERLNIVFKKEVDDGTQKVSPLLLLPFVENAFKHGASETRFDSFINIEIRVQEGHLTLFIANNKEEERNAEQGKDRIGLYNIRRQLELIYSDYEMQVDNQQKTFKVTLNVNLKSHGKI